MTRAALPERGEKLTAHTQRWVEWLSAISPSRKFATHDGYEGRLGNENISPEADKYK